MSPRPVPHAAHADVSRGSRSRSAASPRDVLLPPPWTLRPLPSHPGPTCCGSATRACPGRDPQRGGCPQLAAAPATGDGVLWGCGGHGHPWGCAGNHTTGRSGQGRGCGCHAPSPAATLLQSLPPQRPSRCPPHLPGLIPGVSGPPWTCPGSQCRVRASSRHSPARADMGLHAAPARLLLPALGSAGWVQAHHSPPGSPRAVLEATFATWGHTISSNSSGAAVW